MKRKIIFGSIALLFAAASAFNIGLLQTRDAGDISLDAITIMAQAQGGENCNSCGGYEMLHCKWVTEYVKFDSDGKKIVVARQKSSCRNCAYTCDSTRDGNCTKPELCPRDVEIVI